MYKMPPPCDPDRARRKRRALLVVALGSAACQPRSSAAPASDAAPAATVVADAAPTETPLADAGPPEPRTLYLGPRASLADLCAAANTWYAKQVGRSRSSFRTGSVCLLGASRTLSSDRFLEAAVYSIPSPNPFSERPANEYEPFLALRTARGWFAQPSDSFPMSSGGRRVSIPLDRIAERDGELVAVHLEVEDGQTDERELRCALSDAGAPSCTHFIEKAGVTP